MDVPCQVVLSVWSPTILQTGGGGYAPFVAVSVSTFIYTNRLQTSLSPVFFFPF